MHIEPYIQYLQMLEREGRFRSFPDTELYSLLQQGKLVDFSSNDYMGLASQKLTETAKAEMTSSASRMLATCQRPYRDLEAQLQQMYGRPALLFNSGYHANSGLIPAIALGKTLIVSDKLIHASIIDGIRLSNTRDRLRFRHNDVQALEKIVAKHHAEYDNILVITESIFSMDGDEAPLWQMVDIKRRFPNTILYVDIAHSIGAMGPDGIGLDSSKLANEIDIIVGTFGKACASMGAFVVANREMIEYLRNTTRSLIFSTALPPACIEHTSRMLYRLQTMDRERQHLADISRRLRQGIESLTGEKCVSNSHIVPWIVGDARRVVQMSDELRKRGFLALPIRKPTVPEGTERIRFSLSAAHTTEQIDRLLAVLSELSSTL